VVRLVKLGLKRAGLDPGTLDGRTSPQLDAAIRKYQQTHGLGVDGRASRSLLDHMLGTQVAKIQPATPAPSPAKAPAAQAPVAPPRATAPAREQTAALVAPTPPAVNPSDPGAWNIGRGNELLSLGDIASARLFFEEAISQGSAAGRTALARTYDPLYFAEAQINGPEPDADRAVALYSEAVQAGDGAAQARLDRLRSWMQNR
jgi:peptidoglycan hydrolase-like protein with peptidoglycan-binding domain